LPVSDLFFDFQIDSLVLINRKVNGMCFSPEASFAGGAIISAIGAVTIRKVHKPSQILFACIPFFFGLQQFAEGLLWLTIPLSQYAGLQKISTYIFMIMAQVIWPVMIPLSVLLMEEEAGKKKKIRIFLIVGVVLSFYYAICILSCHINPRITGYHIKYYNDFPESLANPAFFFYLVATISPLFISSVKRIHWMGILMSLSCLVTAIFFTQYLTSVWCFFAALISGVIYWILSDLQKEFLLTRYRLLRILRDEDAGSKAVE
jgi:hypothetical protein